MNPQDKVNLVRVCFYADCHEHEHEHDHDAEAILQLCMGAVVLQQGRSEMNVSSARTFSIHTEDRALVQTFESRLPLIRSTDRQW